MELDWFRFVLENLPSQVLLVVDRNLRYQLVGGESTLAIFNFSRDELLGRTVYEVLGRNADSIILEGYSGALRGTHSTFRRSYRGIHFEQTVFPLYTNSVYGPIGACSLISEVTTERVDDATGSHAVARD